MNNAEKLLVFMSFVFAAACNSGTKEPAASNTVSDSIPQTAGSSATPETKMPAAKNDALKGIWLLQLNDGQVSQDGFVLKEDGTAASINNINLIYRNWQRIGNDSLLLAGKRIENQKQVPFSDTFKLDKITDSAFTISMGKKTYTYRRE